MKIEEAPDEQIFSAATLFEEANAAPSRRNVSMRCDESADRFQKISLAVKKLSGRSITRKVAMNCPAVAASMYLPLPMHTLSNGQWRRCVHMRRKTDGYSGAHIRLAAHLKLPADQLCHSTGNSKAKPQA